MSITLEQFRNLTEGTFERRLMTFFSMCGYSEASLEYNDVVVGKDLGLPDSTTLIRNDGSRCNRLKGDSLLSAIRLLERFGDREASQILDDLLSEFELDEDHRDDYIDVSEEWYEQEGAQVSLTINWCFDRYMCDLALINEIGSAGKSFDESIFKPTPRLYGFLALFCAEKHLLLPEPLIDLAMFDLCGKPLIDRTAVSSFSRRGWEDWDTPSGAIDTMFDLADEAPSPPAWSCKK